MGSLVERERLNERLRHAEAAAVLLHAPAGYGKSVLLGQWAAFDPRPFASIVLTDAHDDPAVLLRSLVEALAPIEPLPAALADAIGTSRPNLDLVAPQLEEALRTRTIASVLVLDELEHLHSEASLHLLGGLLGGIGGELRLAMATRAELPTHVRRLQAERRLDVLGTTDLAMTAGEARSLLAAAGPALPGPEVEAIVAKAEGWPVALCLASLTRRGRSEDDLPDADFGGDERNLVDYMRDELLSAASAEEVDFLTRISFLDRLGGDLCDFVLDAPGSGARLAELSRRNILLVPLDRRDEWFRMHALLAEMLRSELQRRHGDLLAGLNLRASLWAEAAEDPQRAIGFALAAGDHRRAGRLIWEEVPRFDTSGRRATIQRWIEQIGLARAARDPHLSLTVAHGLLAAGDGDGAEHWARISRSLLGSTAVEVASDLPAALALIDAALARRGIAAMATTSGRAVALLDGEGPWAAMADLCHGTAAYLAGDADVAHHSLSDAARRAAVWDMPLVQILALGQLALLAAAEEDWPTARLLASQARVGIDRAGLIARPSVALPMAISAYVNAGEHRRAEALADIAAARALIGRLRGCGAWFVVETAAALAAAAIELNDPAGATELLAIARRHLADVRDAPTLDAWIGTLEEAVGRLSTSGLDELTPAELRVVRLLPSHLSYRQIADELIVSPNTIKSQVRSAYMKLGVSSRHEAVEVCREAGIARSG